MADRPEIPLPLNKPEAIRNAVINEKVSGLLSLGAAVCFLVALQITPITSGASIASALVAVVMFLVYICIKREWATALSGNLLVVSWVLALLVGALFTNGSNSPLMVLAPVTPLISALLRGKDWGWYTAVVLCITIALYGAMEQRGFFVGVEMSDGSLELDLYEFWLVLAVLVGALIGHHMALENDRLQETLRQNARVDFLTGIPKRMSISEALEVASRESKRNSNWLSVMMLDIDHFKRYNDVNGHGAGDECLKKVAATLRTTLNRPYDFVGRYGGEEFSVILPRTDPEGARMVAENLRKAVEALKIPYRAGKPESVTITNGVASAPGALDGRGDLLLKEADSALYTGKEFGRSRVTPTVLDQSGNIVSD